MLPLLAPLAVGVKVTARVHPRPTANGLVQLLVSAKLPVVATLAIESGALPMLVSTIDFGELEVPTLCKPKSSLDVEKATVGVLDHTEAVCGDTLSVLLVLNCIRSKLPSALKSPAVNPRGK